MRIASPQREWLKAYGLGDDIIAGILTGLILIPQALAYASLAGLPAHIGLYAALLPPVVYALFASSQVMSVGPVSVAALMVADAYSNAAVQTSIDAISVSIVLAFEVGLILLILRMLRLGVMNTLLSHTVLSGFTSAAAILIIFSQLDKFIEADISVFLNDMFSISYSASILDANHESLYIGLGLLTCAIGLLQMLGKEPDYKWQKMAKRLVPLLILVLGVFLVSLFQLANTLPLVGHIPSFFPQLVIPSIDFSLWKLLLPSALAIAFVAYIESLSVARVLASRRQERIDANRELLALGAANITAGFSGAMPVAGGFSRSMVNYSSGAKTQRATLVTVLVIILACTFAQTFIEKIPLVALAAIIIVAVFPLIDIKTFEHTWQYDKAEAAVIAVTFSSVLLIGLEFGLLLGVLSAFILHFKRSLKPHIAELGQLNDRPEYRNVLRYETRCDEDTLILRIDEVLYFANITLIEDLINDLLKTRQGVRHLILACNAVNHIDSHALDSLLHMVKRLSENDIDVHFSEVKGPIKDRLNRVGFEQQLASKYFFFTTQDAVNYIREHKSNSKEEAHHGQKIS